jgi:peptidyl-prolyl cis-trans isomerase B (cyclophilin B)
LCFLKEMFTIKAKNMLQCQIEKFLFLVKMEENGMKKLLMVLLIMGLTLGLLTACGDSDADATDEWQNDTEDVTATEDTEHDTGAEEDEGHQVMENIDTVVQIDIEGYGIITVGLDATYAPITVENFVSLVEDGFYDGLTFHRIIDGFMMQGGCNYGNGSGGSGTQILGEFRDNGVDNPGRHHRGAISMARSPDFNSASSQFFIVHEDSFFLDDGYAVFGHVLSGIEVVDDIMINVEVIDDNGTVMPENQPVINSIIVL